MKNFKIICVMVFLLAIMGCSLKKEEGGMDTEQVTIPSKPKVEVNIDGDLIPDSEEIALGLSPHIANIPLIDFTTVSSEIGLSLEGTPQRSAFLSGSFEVGRGSNSKIGSYLKRKVADRAYKEINGIKLSTSDEISILDEQIFTAARWNDQDYFPAKGILEKYKEVVESSGTISSSVKVSLSGFYGVQKIENIKVASFLINRTGNQISRVSINKILKNHDDPEIFEFSSKSDTQDSDKLYKIDQSGFSPQLVRSSILNRSRVGLAVIDYNITTQNGTKLKYSDLRSRIYKNNARVIVVAPTREKIIYATPGTPLVDVLKNVFERIELNEEGEIVSMDGVESQVRLPLDWNHLQNSELDKRIWYVDAPISNLNSNIEAGQTYIVSHMRILDIAQNAKMNFQLLSNEHVWNTVSNNPSIPEEEGYKVLPLELKHGDEVTLFIENVIDSTPIFQDYTSGVRAWFRSCYPSACQGPNDGRLNEYTCTARYRRQTGHDTTSIQVNSDLSNLNMAFKIGKDTYEFGEIAPDGIVPVENGVYIHFKISKDIYFISESFSLALMRNGNVESKNVGFLGYAEGAKCTNPSWHPRVTPNTDPHPTSRQTVTKATTRKYRVSLEVFGIKR